MRLTATIFALATFASGHAFADDIDVAAFEYVDVVETNDGSVLKGVIFEQEPGVRYKLATADGSVHVIQATNVVKLTKSRNRNFRGTATSVEDRGGYGGGGGTALGARYEPKSSLPPPLVASGLRTEFDLAIEFPGGDIESLDTSFAPTFKLGYEQLFGNFGLSGGAFARFSYWMIPGDTGDAMWTLETHAYAQAAFHIGRVAPYFGATLGTDLNYVYDDGLSMSDTTLGFGTNLQFGVKVAATPALTVGFGGDYHPATDTITSGSDKSIEYFALRLGAHLTL
jgi:hypothetical protein